MSNTHAPHLSPDPRSAEERLSAAGLRPTAARLAVLSALLQERRSYSHAELEDRLQNVDIDRVTLYRTLQRFADVGLVSKTVDEERITRFTALDGIRHEDHVHFLCDDCGRVYCLPAHLPRTPALPSGFELERVEYQLHGHCDQCKTHRPTSPKAVR